MDVFRKKAPVWAQSTDGHLLACLSALDLIFLGVGAILGAGIFVLTGIVAATQSGPAIVLSYLVAGLACAFAALSYAELAACIGGCGSAYGYAYAGFGELIAWIVGWDLLLEYAISVSAVSAGWSGYAKDLLRALKISLPQDLLYAPADGGVLNLMAFLVVLVIAGLLSVGVKSSARVNNAMVLVKLTVLLAFILAASGEIQPSNWSPFMPWGFNGVMEGAALIFFAYIGFDAVSTAAEEAKNPQRDLPVGIIGALVICTLLYIVVSIMLTGMVHFTNLNVPSPISHALLVTGHRFVAGLTGIGAIAGLSTVMLVMYYGLTRVFLAMARDGLLPAWFGHVNPQTRTPVRIIAVTGTVIALLSAFVPIHELAELVNIGTLFAFILVCAGVIILRFRHPELERPFKAPFMPWVPVCGILSCMYLIYHLPGVTLMRFVVWMLAGLVLYFSYSRYNSHLNKAAAA
ncbi:amino acid permease [Legionella geestiana]|uniref:amino acid permease n=1 Tax=Legionella geestiana TaxID=45065 RepID=UPI001092CD71|nr:amino acid permease [Legionella geestiana]QDQ39992.1 amino acid permease [Legionella geestiana]